MSSSTARPCLNCGAELRGRFCSHCGQRDVPPAPTLRELLGDAWHEFTVFDNRLLATLGVLLRRPGLLTLEVLAGRRERYIKPLRLYLIVSLTFFLVSAWAPPSPTAQTTATMPGRKEIKIDLLNPRQLSPEERQEMLKNAERAPILLRPLFRRLVTDPVGFRRNMFELLPKVMFALVPVFSAIVAVFYRRRFSQHLVFALHLFAAVFGIMAVRRLANFSGNLPFVAVAESLALLYIVVYSLRAFRKVYGEGWPRVMMKSMGIAVLYVVAATFALTVAALLAASRT